MVKSNNESNLNEQTFLETIFTHRTIRRFQRGATIPSDHQETIERAAQRAASSCSGQMYSFVEITDVKIRTALYEVCGNQTMIRDASIFYVVAADLKRLDTLVAAAGGQCQLGPISGSLIASCDASFAAQNLVLAAEALGYGTAYIGTCGDRCREVSQLLELPERVIPLYGLAIGVPEENPPLRPRLSNPAVFHRNKYELLSDQQLESEIQHMSTELENEGYYRKYTSRKPDYTWKDHLRQKFGGMWLQDVETQRAEVVKSRMQTSD
ncbi:MAG: nitroreductase family protein [Candidatus Heimdallarchaeota archaeon]